MKRCYVVVYTEQGYRYYKVQRPQEKLKASDLVREHVSRVEGSHNESIWDRVNAYYEDILKSKDMVLQGPPDPVLEKVDADFNHFHLYIEQGNAIADNFYSDILGSEKFGTRIGSSKANEVLFPLQNLQNEVCGYFVDTKTGVGDYGESAIGNSLWYSNIPESIDWLIVFKDPREAIAFDKKFRLKNVVYLALGEINYDTTRILFQIQRLTKLKKIVLTFTGSKKIEGYLRDLHFISLMDDSNFLLTLNERDLSVRFDIGEEKSFLRFFNSTKKFNQGLAKSFLNYNKVINQNLINQNSILVSKEDDNIKVRVPLEVNAIKYFVWSYFKNYLSKSLDILKPTYANWNSEWEATQSIQLKGKEVQPEDYRIAL
ncbi:hypothetical protein [Flagellimonas pacifica]|nr:hypothetical protein [Allomuricauda parva]